MMTTTEDPMGHLLVLFPLVFELCKLDEDNMFRTQQFVVPPLDLQLAGILVGWLVLDPFVGWIECVMNYAEMVVG